jgi:hypothetical protein
MTMTIPSSALVAAQIKRQVVGGIHTRAITLMVGNTNCKKL